MLIIQDRQIPEAPRHNFLTLAVQDHKHTLK
jgi:hypothetical protein